ncbi:hypothetical protein HAV21_17140 [Paenarthrobacter sp. MSM-2-10-13]|uniref:hypothetical protein n=1 Tax=Paenarthrobacter sp. MSM-2-10-13 TaxID=2717318 RepID=UPI0014232200|nr:hypothetical protein [Paenarthrobacter sp. MSM-2-10-13]NHW48600.1 hypothetical protein [Paenarthrobacter sp. MSM-2-10-13]
MAAQRTMMSSALLTASLLTAVLALITGILGMHVMTGTHSAHTAAMVSVGMTDTTGSYPAMSEHPTPGLPVSGHASHSVSPSSGPAALQKLSAVNAAPSPAQCSCSGNCSSQHSMSASCIPTVATGALAAPVPDDTVSITAQSAASTIAAPVPWSYRPGSPSPGELSISRT